VRIAFRTAQVRAREHAVEAILRETVGAWIVSSIKAQTNRRKPNVRFDPRALDWRCRPVAR
jgi:hypothetical protein